MTQAPHLPAHPRRSEKSSPFLYTTSAQAPHPGALLLALLRKQTPALPFTLEENNAKSPNQNQLQNKGQDKTQVKVPPPPSHLRKGNQEWQHL